ncbi:hypothetical protein [Lysobacter sp. CA199]|uniref:hypothetical protein n=1 Tax=Lysobacter sp. CA199 TaxID=3455608 RepID=UPI003F8CFF25
MLQQHDLVKDPSASAVPFAEELSDENLEALFGGKPVVCGCGWLCSFTGECGCSNGHSVCVGHC